MAGEDTIHHPENNDIQRVDTAPGTPSRWRFPWAIVIWTVVVTGLLVWLAIGSVSTTSYTYNPFVEVLYRNVSSEPVQEIWTDQARQLPAVEYQAFLDGVFVVSVLAVVGCVVGGSWLLLVRSTDSNHRRLRRPSRPSRTFAR